MIFDAVASYLVVSLLSKFLIYTSQIFPGLTVVDGDEDVGGELQLEVSPVSPVVQGEPFSVFLDTSGVCLEPLDCDWTRNGSSLCSTEEGSTIQSQLDKR